MHIKTWLHLFACIWLRLKLPMANTTLYGWNSTIQKKANWLACNKAYWLQENAFSFWLLQILSCSWQHYWQVLGLEFLRCPHLWYLPNILALGKPSCGWHSQWVGGSHSRPLGNPLWGLSPPHHHPLVQGT